MVYPVLDKTLQCKFSLSPICRIWSSETPVTLIYGTEKKIEIQIF